MSFSKEAITCLIEVCMASSSLKVLLLTTTCLDALQEYILICCQSEYGGLIDKPGK